jgi:mRNA interferase RelE/StbE
MRWWFVSQGGGVGPFSSACATPWASTSDTATPGYGSQHLAYNGHRKPPVEEQATNARPAHAPATAPSRPSRARGQTQSWAPNRPCGAEGWRIRTGTYRIVYLIDDAARVVTVTRISHRKDVYRRL